MFSKTCEYGIRAVIYIATASLQGRRVKIDDVVDNTGSPKAFTGKILGTLNRHGIIDSCTGPNGGFEISREKMEDTRLSDIVFALEGDALYTGCGLGLSECNSARPCPMHKSFVRVRAQLKAMLEGTTILQLAKGVKKGDVLLMR